MRKGGIGYARPLETQRRPRNASTLQMEVMTMRRRWLAAVAALVTLAIASQWARAQMGRPPGPPGPPPPLGALLVGVHLTADQETQVRTIMETHRQAVEPLRQQLDTQHEQLMNKLTSPGQITLAELTPLDQEIAQTEQQLDQEMLKTAVEIRGILTPEQLATAAANGQKLAEIHSEMRALMGPPPIAAADAP
jgi:periplasmic protein CpxP/Spy